MTTELDLNNRDVRIALYQALNNVILDARTRAAEQAAKGHGTFSSAEDLAQAILVLKALLPPHC